MPTTLLIATRNAHKVGEIRAILGGRYSYLSLSDFPNAPEVVEDAGTFGGNATKKAVELAKWIAAGAGIGDLNVRAASADSKSFFVLADDSGLEVDALNGAPGVHSARFAALDTGAPGNSPTAANNAKLVRLLEGIPPAKRTARFRCVIALTPVSEPRQQGASPVCYANEFEFQTELFDGVCEGSILQEPRGGGGFGYDPLFVPRGQEETFAEIGEHIKNQLSHRARALTAVRERLARLG